MSSKESMRDQASQIWSFLDDISRNDPAAYKRFIEKQMEERKEALAPPEPHMCVSTMSKHGLVYLNICSWQRIPYPKSDQDPIPVMGGELYAEHDKSVGPYECITLTFNPKILNEIGVDSDRHKEQLMLINLALDYCRDVHKIELSRQYTLHPISMRFKGDLKKVQSSIMKQTKDKDEQFDAEMEEIKNEFAPPGMSSDLLSDIANMSMGNDSKSKRKTAGNYDNVDIDPFLKQKAPEIKIGKNDVVEKKKPGLIQEIASVEKSIPEPEYSVQQKEGKDSTMKYTVKVKLPGVLSVSECVLEIEKNLHVEVEGQYKLKLPLPDSLQTELGAAKFSKRSSTLTVTFPMSVSEAEHS